MNKKIRERFTRSDKRQSAEQIRLNTRMCRACWKCVTTCPQKVFGKIDFPFHKHVRIEHGERCLGCLVCVQTCPHGAITPVGAS